MICYCCIVSTSYLYIVISHLISHLSLIASIINQPKPIMRSLLPNVLISTSVLLILSILSVSHAIDIEKITINRPKKIPKELPPEPDFTNKLDDDVCAGMVADHKCDDMPDLMKQFCHKACYEQVKEKLYFKRIEFDDTLTDEFFALRATNWTGSELHFEDFDGYVSKGNTVG